MLLMPNLRLLQQACPLRPTPARALLFRLHAAQAASPRWNSIDNHQPPDKPAGDNMHRGFWKQFGRPVAKVFLLAMFTYQLTYWSWLKLESFEIKEQKDEEIRTLEGKLKSLTGRDKKDTP